MRCLDICPDRTGLIKNVDLTFKQGFPHYVHIAVINQMVYNTRFTLTYYNIMFHVKQFYQI